MEVRRVRWIDSAAQVGWGDRESFADHSVSTNESVGFVLRDDVDQVVLVQSIDTTHDNLDAAIAIPWACITSSEILRPAREETPA